MSDPEPQSRSEAEGLQRQAQRMAQRRPETEARTRSAVRRALIVLAIFATAVLLWRAAG